MKQIHTLSEAKRKQYEFLKAEGHSKVVIAKLMGMSKHTLYQATAGQ